MLGGVEIPESPGLEGHSDADVVLHAVVDALLGAAALGDLGSRFGVAEDTYAGAASSVFVVEALCAVRRAGFQVANVDCTVVAERPRIAPHRVRIVERLADLLEIPPQAVSVKATTTDGLGMLGRGEGMACMAIALLHTASAGEAAACS
jgi:2-C-methyl-D-erythritol 2,4-cyclodiphosphate synthase